MGQLPIELVRLRERYEQLVADASSGAIGRDDAYRLLAQLTVIDGHGAQWGLDDEGGFTRRMNPSEQPTAANPGAFVPLGTAPVVRQEVIQPVPVQPSTPQQVPVQTPHSMPGPSIKGEPDFTRHVLHERTDRLVAVKKVVASYPGAAIVAGLLVTALLLSVVTRGSRQTPAPKAPTTTASAATPSTGVVPATPTGEDVARVIAALGTDPVTAATVVIGPQNPVEVAQWKGLLASGLRFEALPAPSVPAGSPVAQQWAAFDAAGIQQAIFAVAWVRDGDTWKLQGWPVRS
jgi:hypothetical protein